MKDSKLHTDENVTNTEHNWGQYIHRQTSREGSTAETHQVINNRNKSWTRTPGAEDYKMNQEVKHSWTHEDRSTKVKNKTWEDCKIRARTDTGPNRGQDYTKHGDIRLRTKTQAKIIKHRSTQTRKNTKHELRHKTKNLNAGLRIETRQILRNLNMRMNQRID